MKTTRREQAGLAWLMTLGLLHAAMPGCATETDDSWLDDEPLPAGTVRPSDPTALAVGPSGTPVALEPGCATAVCCPTGSTVLQGDAGPNALGGGTSARCLVGLGGDDVLTSSTAGDFIVAGPGADTAQGAAGIDVAHGGPGIDTLYGGDAADALHGGWDGDELHGGAGNDQLHGDEADDTLHGDADDDTLHGGQGDDTLEGGADDDLLWGGPGSDTVLGGDGDDRIRIGNACELTRADTVVGGDGWDVIESPYGARTLAAMGVSISEVEAFETIPLSFEQCVTVTDEWGGEVTVSGEIFDRLVPRLGGGALGLRPGVVHVVSPTGAVTASVPGDSIAIDPTGSGFALTDATGGTSVYDASGAFRYAVAITASDTYLQLLPGGDHLYVGLIEREHEVARVDAFEIHDDQGLRASVAAPGLRVSRLGVARVLYSDATHVRAVDLDGVPQWSTAVDVRTFEAAPTGPARFIGVQALTATTLVHYEGATLLSTTQVPGGVWNVAISPSGEHSAANTADGLYVFTDGLVTATVQLPLAYGKALAINDQGEVLVSGVDDADVARVLLLHSDGQVLWDTTLLADRNAWRPAAAFEPSGDSFVVNTSLGGFHHAIVRSL